ncbi:MAG: hypothetical protein GC168_11005 [Candidatus Hydrogenedens sp.]|nr:hypothetical protein [Candidatus Hydrogenedens sp.]
MADAPTEKRSELRIYCLCGQKMRVHAAMFGRPGKCVACRQKIRVPRRDEVPTGVTEIYLKDHPEFLRISSSPLKKKRTADSPAQPPSGRRIAGGYADDEVRDPDMLLGDPEETPKTTPLDTLKSLQVVCSFEWKIHERLNAMRDATRDPELAREKAALMGYRALVRNARADLDEKLRQRLHEVTSQIADARENIAKATLAVRVGDMTFTAFRQTVEALRQRRDRLERRRTNLSGWLNTKDPYIAGGFLDLPFEEIPVEELEVSFSIDSTDAEHFLESHLTALRAALRDRESARRKVEGSRRMAHEDGISVRESQRLERIEEAALKRARARVEFVRGRLEQLMQDCDNDSRAVRAHLEDAQARAARGEFDANEFAHIEQEMLRIQSEYNESRTLARQGLRAENAQEVPQARNSLVRRVAAAPAEQVLFSADRIMAWGSTIALALSTVLPLVSGQSASNLHLFPFLVGGMLLGAIAFGSLGLVTDREVRGGGMLLIWMGVVLWACVWLQSARFALTPLGGIMRTDPRWYVTPGMFTLALAVVGMGLASSVTLAASQRTRALPLGAALVTLASIALILSDGAGVMSSRPAMGDPEIRESQSEPGTYAVGITLRNEGRRSYWLGASLQEVPDPVRFSLERRLGEDSWEDYTLVDQPGRVEGNMGTPFAIRRMARIEVEPMQTHTMHYTLPPGEYRARMWPGTHLIERTFQLAPIVPEPVLETPEPASPEPALSATSGSGGMQEVRCKLQGVLDSRGRDPVFSLTIETSDGRILNPRIELGAHVYGNWYASEYSPDAQSLTLSNGQEFLILERGEPIQLPVEESNGVPARPAAAPPRSP